ncbi:TIGR01777 family oxidoreductase [Thermoplasmatales archaeon AK]|nr:TIGR01777 family oxidoreductase [Thermoplasmatales archaeon AK]
MADIEKIAVFGATGTIGGALLRELSGSNYSVTAFARDGSKLAAISHGNIIGKLLPESPEKLSSELEGAKAVFNFTGAPIFRRWSREYRNEIIKSRVDFTRNISRAILGCTDPPRVFVNGSASGIYGYDSFDDSDVTEDHSAASDFWGKLVSDWESAANESARSGVRVVNIRTTVVLDSKSGALPELVRLFQRGLGGAIRPGTQWFPWIHIKDEIGLAVFAMNRDDISGPLNAGSPNVPRMDEFARELGNVLGKPSRIKIPVTVLRLFLGEVTEVMSKGKKVVPARALQLGYEFKFPDLNSALRDLLA